MMSEHSKLHSCSGRARRGALKTCLAVGVVGMLGLARSGAPAPAAALPIPPVPALSGAPGSVQLRINRQAGGGLAGGPGTSDTGDADKSYHILKVNHIYVGGISNLFSDAGHIYTEDFIKDDESGGMGGMMGGMGGFGGGMMGGMGGFGGGMMGGMGGFGGGMGGFGGGMGGFGGGIGGLGGFGGGGFGGGGFGGNGFGFGF